MDTNHSLTGIAYLANYETNSNISHTAAVAQCDSANTYRMKTYIYINCTLRDPNKCPKVTQYLRLSA